MQSSDDGSNPDFNRIRTEAESVLQRLLAPNVGTWDIEGINREADRARAFAALDCWAPRWLKSSFEEIDRIRRWQDLRSRQVQAVLDLHAAAEVGTADYPDLLCRECALPYPCNTRKAILRIK
jgi:hypothetical protein